MKQLNNITKTAIALSVLLIIGGLTFSAANMQAAVPAHSLSKSQAVTDTVHTVASVNGVKVNIRETWIGDPGITEEVTPIEVSIQNNSDKPISLHYDQFWIVTRDGYVYTAIPPLKLTVK